MFAQWDDHEVTNDWSPTGSYDDAGYEDDGTPRLVARARRAFFDFMPIPDIGARQGRVYRKIAYGPLLDVFMIDMRSYRDETWNKGNDHRGWILGAEQLAWLKRELAASRATWKVIAADLPIGLISLDAVALGDGPPDRREHEIADLLASIKRAGVRNIVWLTADMHYTAAHYYDPNRAQFQRFRAVLGVRLRPSACRHLGPRRARQHVWPRGDVPERVQRSPGREPRALLRPAVLRPRRHRRHKRRDDGDLEGRRQSRSLVGRHRAAAAGAPGRGGAAFVRDGQLPPPSWPGLTRPSTPCGRVRKAWMPGTSPGMTVRKHLTRS